MADEIRSVLNAEVIAHFRRQQIAAEREMMRHHDRIMSRMFTPEMRERAKARNETTLDLYRTGANKVLMLEQISALDINKTATP